MGDLLKSVLRVLSIQEQRQAEYNKLKKAHNEYTTLVITLSDYQKAMADITASFQSLSQEMIVLRQVVSDHSLLQAAKVLDQIQAQEKHKLTLTAEWQVLVTVDTEAEEFDLIQHTHNLKTLRQKLAAVEGRIAELVQDLRYECEHVLLTVVTQEI